MLLHAINQNNQMALLAYENIDGIFRKLKFPAKAVNGYKLDNILFIAHNLFPLADLETITTKNIDEKSYNGYDDIQLLQFSVKYDLESSKKYKIQTLKDGKIQTKRLEIGQEPCSMAAHQCRNGSSEATECHPTGGGCRTPTCPRESSAFGMYNNNLLSELQSLNSDLPENDLHQFKDNLLMFNSGDFYIDAYYATSSHFRNSIDINLLYEVAFGTNDIGQTVSAFLTNQSSYIFNNQTFQKVTNIMDKSADLSSSNLYKDVIEDLKEDLIQFKSQNIYEIKQILNN